MPKNRPAIPEPIKREVRQRCGFGCVICGCPLYEYEHMLEWAVVERHEASEITLLCPNHHSEKTRKKLSPEIVEEANEKPYNLNKDFSVPDPLHFKGERATVNIGNCKFTTKDNGNGTSLIALQILEKPIIKVTLMDGSYLIDVDLFNKDNNLLLSIKNSVLEYSLGTWDIEFVGNTLTIREEPRDIFVEITFESPDTITIKRANLFFASINVVITPECIRYENNEMSGIGADNASVGIWITNIPDAPPPYN